MFQSRRRRRGPYSIAPQSRVPRTLPLLLLLVVVVGGVFYLGATMIRWIGVFAGGSNRTAVQMELQSNPSAVSVSLDGGDPQRAQPGLPLYTGDAVSTEAGARVLLTFFGGSSVRLDELTDVKIVESANDREKPAISLALSQGRLWVRVPAAKTATGAVFWTIVTPTLELTLPPATDAIISPRSLLVFRAEGLGIALSVSGAKGPITIGEGQQFVLPDTAQPTDDLYSYRSPLSAAQTDSFVVETRQQSVDEPSSAALTGATLAVEAPADGQTVSAATVAVSGRVSAKVDRVRVNGYSVKVGQDRTFTQELVFGESDAALTIHTEALDRQGIVLSEDQRSVKRTGGTRTTDTTAPRIVSPAQAGQTYRTQDSDLVIRGTVPEGTVSVYVNDYKLLFFKEGETDWQYLAKSTLGNLLPGRNVYDVVAVDAAGRRSPVASLVILLEEGTVGIVTGAAGSSASSSSSVIDETQLPKNAPLDPGTLQVTGPAPGETYAATETGILITGITSPKTMNVWVNGYRLQLYKPGRTTWSYIASEELRNMKTGTNVYVINARDKDDKILDTATYTVTH